jgi:hypothetical protein
MSLPPPVMAICLAGHYFCSPGGKSPTPRVYHESRKKINDYLLLRN